MESRYLLMIIWVCFPCISVMAQWTGQDSLRLKRQLAGDEPIRLSPETDRLISEGKLLNYGRPEVKPLEATPLTLQISKDFDEYIFFEDTTLKVFDIMDLPPQVFKQYMMQRDSVLGIHGSVYTPGKIPALEKEFFRIGKSPLYIRGSADNLFMPEVKDGQKRGSINLRLKYEFSMEDILRSIFWKSERDKKRNKKQAQAYKYYNQMPTY